MTDFLAKIQLGEILALLGHNGAGKFDTQRPAQTNDSLLGLMKVVAGLVAFPKVDHSINAHRGSAANRGVSWLDATKGEEVVCLDFWWFLFVGSLLCFFILVLPLGGLCFAAWFWFNMLVPTSEGLAPWQIIVCSMHLLRRTKTLGVIMLLKMTGNHSLFSLVAGFDFLMQHDDKQQQLAIAVAVALGTWQYT